MVTPVAAPAIFRHRHSLVDVGNLVSGGRWEDGVVFTPRGCGVFHAHQAGCLYPWALMKDHLQGCVPVAEFHPYLLEMTMIWNNIDLAADPKAMIMEAMDVGTSAALERLIENGIEPTGTGGTMDQTQPLPLMPWTPDVIHTAGISGRALDPQPNWTYPLLDDPPSIDVNALAPQWASG